MPTVTPDNSQLDRPYPSDPAKRYRQGRVGQPVNPARANAVWTITIDATAGSAAISCTIDGKLVKQDFSLASHGLVAFNANAAAMQTMWEGQVGAGNVTVTGGPGASGGGTPYVVTFGGELAGQPVKMSGLSAFLTGGGAALTLVETTPGGVVAPTVPIGPTLSTNDANPSNSPRRREGETLT